MFNKSINKIKLSAMLATLVMGLAVATTINFTPKKVDNVNDMPLVVEAAITPTDTATTWSEFRTMVQNAANGDIIGVAADLEYSASSRNQTITVDNEVTIVAVGANRKITLSSAGTRSYYMFSVKGTGTLNLGSSSADYTLTFDSVVSSSSYQGNTFVYNQNGGTLNLYDHLVMENSENLYTGTTAGRAGGCIYNASTVNIYGGIYRNNKANRGGVVYSYPRNATSNCYVNVYGGTFENNSVDTNGGVFYNQFTGYATSGAVVYNIEGGTYVGNRAVDDGAVLNSQNNYGQNALVISGGTFNGNSVTGSVIGGGAIAYKTNMTSNLDYAGIIINGGTFTNNSSTVFGGAISSKTNVEINDGTFTNNSTEQSGGAVYAAGDITITGGTFTANKASINGGAVALDGNLVVDCAQGKRIIFEGGAGEEAVDGGAIYISGDSVTCKIVGAQFKSGLSVSNNGGAVFLGCTLTDNIQATFVGGVAAKNGGAIYSTQNLILGNGCEFYGNKANYGGAVYCDNDYFDGTNYNVVINQAIFGNEAQANEAVFGGAIYADGAVNVIDGSIKYNKATSGNGAGIYAGNNIIINAGDISYNVASPTMVGDTQIIDEATGLGGGFYANGAVVIDNATISYNSAYMGGGFYTMGSNGVITINSGNINHNSATKNGGAIYNKSASTTINGGTLSNNTAENGGAIYAEYDVAVTGGIFSANKATNNGGNIFTLGELIIDDSTTNPLFYGGEAVNGAVIYTSAKVTINGGTFGGNGTKANNNKATNGGAIYFNSTTNTITIQKGTFAGNQATANGGAIWSSGTIVLNGGALGNASTNYENTAANGGAIFTSGTTTITSGTIIGNQATTSGAGIYTTGNLTVTGGTISNNIASATSVTTYGGAIYVGTNGSAVIGNAVISGNSATNGGAIYNVAGTEVSIANGTFNNNSATNGGVVYTPSDAILTLSGGTFGGDTANNATLGDAIYMAGTLNLSGNANVKNSIYLADNVIINQTTVLAQHSASNKIKLEVSNNAEIGRKVVYRNGVAASVTNCYELVNATASQYLVEISRAEAPYNGETYLEVGGTFNISVNIYYPNSYANVTTVAANYGDTYAATTGFNAVQRVGFVKNTANPYYRLVSNTPTNIPANDLVYYNVAVYCNWDLDVPVATVSSSKDTAVYGETITLTANITNYNADINYTYQWKKGEVNIEGATNSTLVIADVADSGTYTCAVTASSTKLGQTAHNGNDASNQTTNTISSAKTVSITKKAITLSLIDDSYEYNHNEQNITTNNVTVNGLVYGQTIDTLLDEDGVDKLVYTYGNVGTVVNTYTLQFALNGANSNYVLSSSSLTWYITKLTLTMEWVVTEYNNSEKTTVITPTRPYNNTAPEYSGNYFEVMPLFTNINEDDVTFDVISGTNGASNVSSFIANLVSIKGDDAGNYNLPTVTSFSWEITKLRLSIDYWKTNNDAIITPTLVNGENTYSGYAYDGTVKNVYAVLKDTKGNPAPAGITPLYNGNGKINAGSYVVYISGLTGTNASNYEVQTTNFNDYKINMVISQKTVNIVSWTDFSGFVYDGNVKTVQATAVTGGLDANANATLLGKLVYANNSYTNAGTNYVTTATLTDTNYILEGETTLTWDIDKKEVRFIWYNQNGLSPYSSPLTYNGNKQSIIVKFVSDGYRMVTGEAFAINYTGNGTNAINAGNYSTTVQFGDNTADLDNYIIRDENGEDVLYTRNWSINPLTLVLENWITDTITSAIYSASSFNYAYDTERNVYPIFSNVDSESFDYLSLWNAMTGSSATDAGNYTATMVSVGENPNYTLPTIKTFDWKINKQQYTVTWIEPENLTYSGIAKGVSVDTTIAVNMNDGVYVAYAEDSVHSATNVDEYIAKVQLTGTRATNYEIVNPTKTWEITPAPLTANWGTLVYDYNGTTRTLTASVVGKLNASDDVEFTYVGGTNSRKDVGSTPVTINGLTGDHAGNYYVNETNENKSKTLVIKAIVISVNWTPNVEGGSPFIGDNTPKYYTPSITNLVTVNEVEETVVINTNPASYNNFRNAGNYSVTIIGLSGANASNYTIAGASNLTQEWIILSQTIQNNNISYSDGVNTYAYDDIIAVPYKAGDYTITPTLKNNDNPAVAFALTDYTVSGNVQRNANTDESTYTITITITKSGWTFVGGLTTLTKTWTITPITATLLFENNNYTYDGNNHSLSARVTNIIGGDSVLVTGYSANNTRKEHGETTGITVTSLSNSNYILPTGNANNGTLTINQKVVTIVWEGTNTENLTYSAGTAKYFTPKISNLIGLENATLNVNIDLTACVDAGEYTTTVTGVEGGNGNYTIVGATNITKSWTITPKELTATWGTNVFNYDKSLKTLTVSIADGGITLVNGTDYIVTGNTATDVVTDKVATVSMQNDNYTLLNPTKTWNINPKAVIISWELTAGGDLNYGGDKTYTARVTNNEAGDTVNVSTYSGDSNTQANAGTYTTTVASISNGNYTLTNGTNISLTWSILPRKLVISGWSISDGENIVTEANAIYDGTTTYTITPNYSNAVAGNTISNVIANNSYQNAGSYTAVLTGITGDSNYVMPTANTEISWTIKARPLTITWGVENNYAYTYENNTVRNVTVEIKDGEYTLIDGTDYTVAENSATNVGEYVATVTMLNTNYSIAVFTRAWSIKQAEAELSWSVANNHAYTYNGTNYVVTAQVTNGGDDTFALTYTGNSNKNASDTAYTATVTGLGNANYKLPANVTLNYYINPITLNVNWLNDNTPATTYSGNYVYNGVNRSITAQVDGVVGADVVNLEYLTYATGDVNKISLTNIKNVGAYTTEISSIDNTNYTVSSSKEWNIIAKSVTVAWSNYTNLTYTGAPQTISYALNGLVDGENSASNYTANNITYTDATSTGYNASVSLNDNISSNYTISGNTLTWYIAKYTLESLNWSNNEFTYDGSIKEVTIVSAVGVNSQLITLTYNYTNNEQTTVGEYTASAVCTDNNYQIDATTLNSTCTYEINPATITNVEWSNTPTFEFDADDKGVEVIATNNEGVSFIYAPLTAVNVGSYTKTIIGVANENYTIEDISEAQLSYTFTITEKEITVSWKLDEVANGSTVEFNGSNHTITINNYHDSITDEDVSLAITGDLAARNFGSYRVVVVSSNNNYIVVNSPINWSITAQQVTFTPSTNHTYTGSPITLSGVLSGVKGSDDVSVLYTANKATTYQVTNAGNYNNVHIELTGANASNYQLATDTASWTIGTRKITISWNNSNNYNYDGTAVQPTYELGNVVASDGNTCLVSYRQNEDDLSNAPVNSGTGYIKLVRIIDNNYSWADSQTTSANYSIVAVSPTIELIPLTSLVNGHNVSVLILVKGAQNGVQPTGSVTYAAYTSNDLSTSTAHTISLKNAGALQQNNLLSQITSYVGNSTYSNQIRNYLLTNPNASYAVATYSELGSTYYVQSVYTEAAEEANYISTSTSAIEMVPAGQTQDAFYLYGNGGSQITGEVSKTYGDSLELYLYGGTELDTDTYGIMINNVRYTATDNSNQYVNITYAEGDSFPFYHNAKFTLYFKTVFTTPLTITAFKEAGSIGATNYAEVTSQTITVTSAKKLVSNVTITDSTKIFGNPAITYGTVSVGSGLVNEAELTSADFTIDRIFPENDDMATTYNDEIIVTLNNPLYYMESAIYGDLVISKKALTQTDVNITLTNSTYTYTSNAIDVELEARLKIGGTLLSVENDYDISYDNNIVKGSHVVTLTFKGNYSGTATANFEIIPANASNFVIEELNDIVYVKDSEAIVLEPLVMFDNEPLLRDEDYELSYSSDTRNVGTVTITVTGKGNFIGSTTTTYNITPYTLTNTDIENSELTLDENTYIYDGSVHTPIVTSISNGNGWTITTDDIASYAYSNNINVAGEHTVTITLTRNYVGQLSKTFTINPASMVGATVVVNGNYIYTGSQITPTNLTVTFGGKTLTAGVDYEIDTNNYGENINVTTGGSVTVIGKGNFDASTSKSANFAIAKRSINTYPQEFAIDNILDIVYTGEDIKPTIALRYTENGKSPVEISNTEYGLSYSADVINTGIVTVTATVNGENSNFTGTISKNYNIVARTYDADEFVISAISAKTYNGLLQTVTPSEVVVTYKGVTPNIILTRNTDYTYVVNGTDAGVNAGSVTINFIKNFTLIGAESNCVVYFDINRLDMTGNANFTVDTVLPKTFNRGEAITPRPNAYYNGTLLTDASVEYSYSANTNVGIATITISGKETGNFAGSITRTFEIVEKSIEYATVAAIANVNYNGNAHTPTITVSDNNELVLNTHYTVGYSNNINAGTNTAVVTITGIGDYTGTKVVNFTINKIDLANITIEGVNNSYIYTGSSITPTVTAVKFNGSITLPAEHYSQSYGVNTNVAEDGLVVRITATDYANFTSGSYVEFTYDITAKELANTDINSITLSATDFVYDNTAYTPTFASVDSTWVIRLEEDIDDYSYSNNIEAGIATVTAILKGNYTGSISTSFVIDKLNISNAVVEISSKVYTGSAITLTDADITSITCNGLTVTYTLGGYTTNTNAGVNTASVTFTGNGNFTGTYTSNFTIDRRTYNKDEFNIDDVIAQIGSKVYTGSAINIDNVTLKYNDSITLVKDRDYNIVTTNNTNTTNSALVTITFLRNFFGTTGEDIKFSIVARSMETYLTNFAVTLSQNVYTYSGSDNNPEPTVVYTFNGERKTLVKGTDYEVDYLQEKNAGTSAMVVISGKGNFVDDIVQNFTIQQKDINLLDVSLINSTRTYTGSQITISSSELNLGVLEEGIDFTLSWGDNINVSTGGTVILNGINNYNGTKTISFTIDKLSILSGEIDIQDSIANVEYNGSPHTPNVLITKGHYTLVRNTDYRLTHINNTDVGTATITIVGIGNYAGEDERTFVISKQTITAENISIDAGVVYYNGNRSGDNGAVPSSLVVRYAGAIIPSGHYSVVYSDNNDIGTAIATITLNANSNYTLVGSAVKTYTVSPLVYNKTNFVIDDIDTQRYCGVAITPTPAVRLVFGEYSELLDVDYSYDNNVNITTASSKAEVIITFKGNISASVKAIKEFDINVSDLTIADITINGVNGIADQVYNGDYIVPSKTGLSIKYGNVTITADEYDITVEEIDANKNVSYTGNTVIEAANATITFKGARFQGTINNIPFKIIPASIESAVATINEGFSNIYTGSAISPNITVMFNENIVDSSNYEVYYGEQDQINYTGNTIFAELRGKGNFAGSQAGAVQFKIVQKDLSDADITIDDISAQEFTGTAITIGSGNIVVRRNNTPISTDYYTVSYSNNVNVGNPVITFTGKGNYKGVTTKPFAITAKAITINDIDVTVLDTCVYTGELFEPDFIVTLKGTDIPITCLQDSIEYANNRDKSEAAEIKFTPTGNYTSIGKITALFTIAPKTYDNTIEISLNNNSFGYTGTEISPIVTITDTTLVGEEDKKLALDSDYSIMLDDNTDVGIATITITFIGNYIGSTVKTFTITAGTYTAEQAAYIDKDSSENEIIGTYTPTLTLNDLTFNPNPANGYSPLDYRWVDPSISLSVGTNNYNAWYHKWTGDGYDNNYEPKLVTIEVVINKAAYSSDDVEEVNPIIVYFTENLRLYDIELPTNYSWQTLDRDITGIGSIPGLKAQYNADPVHYNTYNDIPVSLTIVKGTLSAVTYAHDSIVLTYAEGLTLSNAVLNDNYMWNNSATSLSYTGDEIGGYKEYTATYNYNGSMSDLYNSNYNELEVQVKVYVNRADYTLAYVNEQFGNYSIPTQTFIKNRNLANMGLTLPEGFTWKTNTALLEYGTKFYDLVYNADSSVNENYNSYGNNVGQLFQISINVVSPEISGYWTSDDRVSEQNVSKNETENIQNVYSIDFDAQGEEFNAQPLRPLPYAVKVVSGAEDNTVIPGTTVWVSNQSQSSTAGIKTYSVIFTPTNSIDKAYINGANSMVFSVYVAIVGQEIIVEDSIVFENQLDIRYNANKTDFAKITGALLPSGETFDVSNFRNYVDYSYIEVVRNGDTYVDKTGATIKPLTNTVALSIGSYRIIASLNNGNCQFYNFVENDQTVTQINKIVTILPSDALITFADDAIEKTYGDEEISLTDEQIMITSSPEGFEDMFEYYIAYVEIGVDENDPTYAAKLREAMENATEADKVTTFNSTSKSGVYFVKLKQKSDAQISNNYVIVLQDGIYVINPKEVTLKFEKPSGLVAKGNDELMKKIQEAISISSGTLVGESVTITVKYYKNGQEVTDINAMGSYVAKVQFSSPNYYSEQEFEFSVAPDMTGTYITIGVLSFVGLCVLVIVSIVTYKVIKKRAKKNIETKIQQEGKFGQADMLAKLRRGEDVTAFGAKTVTKEELKKEMEHLKQSKKADKDKK